MARCFSFTASRDWFYRYSFFSAGLRSVTTDLGEGTIMHCWVPKTHNNSKPNLLLVHGFGANAMWQYEEPLRHFTARFNVYVPDLARLLRRVVHEQAGPDRSVPGSVRDEHDGGARGAQDEPGGDKLRWVCGLQHGGAIPAEGGQVGAVLQRCLLGREGYGKRAV
ncbi:hypothetical protein SLA2020_371910 [Shorea laevis]